MPYKNAAQRSLSGILLLKRNIAMVSPISPLVSIVMATYNRSNIIAYAIQAVLDGTLQDWELIVVGDCCTDNTAEVIAAFADPRIRFVNLEKNFGEQTGPNNIGISLARGTYLAFLNHDDLWLPNHLQQNVDILAKGDVDLVFDQGLVIMSSGNYIAGALAGQLTSYSPWTDVPASLWVMRRELAMEIGPWQPSWELRSWPSQAWLHRAYRAGRCIIANPHLGAILIQSGSRSNAYLDRQHQEHAFWAIHMRDPLNVLHAYAAIHGASVRRCSLSPSHCARETLKTILRRIFLAMRLWPPHLNYWLKYWRKGAFVRDLRRRRGLSDRPL